MPYHRAETPRPEYRFLDSVSPWRFEGIEKRRSLSAKSRLDPSMWIDSVQLHFIITRYALRFTLSSAILC
jgi:hypothetical protein